MSPRRPAWLGGLVVGVAAGVLALELPIVGWALAAAFVAVALLNRARLGAIGGLATGAGAAWLLVIGRSIVARDSFTGPGRACVEPDLTPWLITAAGMLVVGILATAATLRP